MPSIALTGLSGKLSGDCRLSHLNRPFPSNLRQSRGLALPDSSQHSETKTIKPIYFKVADCCSDESFFYRCIFKTVFSVIFILLFSFPVNFLFWILYISVMKLPFVFHMSSTSLLKILTFFIICGVSLIIGTLV